MQPMRNIHRHSGSNLLATRLLAAGLFPVIVLFLTTGIALLSLSAARAQTTENSEQPTATDDLEVVTTHEKQMAALAKMQPQSTEVIWLETRQESFLGLLELANRGQPEGNILILPDDRTSPDWPVIVHDLRRQLPDYGWNTLAVELPPLPQPDAVRAVQLPVIDMPASGTPAQADAASQTDPNQPDTTQTDPAAADDDAPDYQAYSSQAFERISAARNQLASRSEGQQVIIGLGSGAYWASRYLQENPEPMTYLILIDAQQPAAISEPKLTALLSELQATTLDLYHSSNLPDSAEEEAAALRRNAVARSQRNGYAQRRMPVTPMPVAQKNQRLVQTLRGRLQKHMETQPGLQDPNPITEAMEQRPGTGPAR